MEISAMRRGLMDFPSKAPGQIQGFYPSHPVNLIWELGKGEEGQALVPLCDSFCWQGAEPIRTHQTQGRGEGGDDPWSSRWRLPTRNGGGNRVLKIPPNKPTLRELQSHIPDVFCARIPQIPPQKHSPSTSKVANATGAVPCRSSRSRWRTLPR